MPTPTALGQKHQNMHEVWLRPDEAAALLTQLRGKPTTTNATTKTATRHQWRKKGTGPNTRYNYNDIINTHDQRLIDILTKGRHP